MSLKFQGLQTAVYATVPAPPPPLGKESGTKTKGNLVQV